MNRIALISTPWPLFSRPSIQLGTLKAYIKQNLPNARVHCHHIYLSVASAPGYDLYGEISERSWLAESAYAALLFPDREETIERFRGRSSSGLPNLAGNIIMVFPSGLAMVVQSGTCIRPTASRECRVHRLSPFPDTLYPEKRRILHCLSGSQDYIVAPYRHCLHGPEAPPRVLLLKDQCH